MHQQVQAAVRVIPLSTTTISVLRPVDGDPYEASAGAPAVVAQGVRAHISVPNIGSGQIVGGQQSVVEPRLTCDLCDLKHTDEVKDDTTGRIFQVTWVQERLGLGVDHLEAGLRKVEGAA